MITEEMMLRTWLLLALSSLILLFVSAYFNKVIVYRDYNDLGWSLSLTYTPILTFTILVFILQDDAELSAFITETILGMSIFATGTAITAISIFKIYNNSIRDNNLLLGIFIGSIAGLLISINFGSIISFIEGLFNVQLLQVYFINYFPIDIRFEWVTSICLITFFFCLLFTIYPSRLASKVDPVEVLKYE